MSAFDESLHPRQPSGRFTDRVNSAPSTGLGGVRVEPRPYAVQWDGSSDVMIASETNPWLEDADGDRIIWNTTDVEPDGDCECAASPVPGVLVGMDTPEGIQRCDACGRYESDLDAAAAAAEDGNARPGPRVSVWFTPAADPSSGRVSRRSDCRLEVVDAEDANLAYGCRLDDWCILADGHDGDCNEDREHWEGPDVLYPAEPTPAERLAEYEAPRAEDIAEAEAYAEAQAWLEPVTPERVASSARTIAQLRAAERMWVDGVAHPGDDIFESIWTTDEGGFGESTCRREIDSCVELRAGLAAGRIRPREVIGTGYRGDTRKLANEYLDRQQAQFERALETRGRNLSVNVSNVRYRLRKSGLLGE